MAGFTTTSSIKYNGANYSIAMNIGEIILGNMVQIISIVGSSFHEQSFAGAFRSVAGYAAYYAPAFLPAKTTAIGAFARLPSTF